MDRENFLKTCRWLKLHLWILNRSGPIIHCDCASSTSGWIVDDGNLVLIYFRMLWFDKRVWIYREIDSSMIWKYLKNFEMFFSLLKFSEISFFDISRKYSSKRYDCTKIDYDMYNLKWWLFNLFYGHKVKRWHFDMFNWS